MPRDARGNLRTFRARLCGWLRHHPRSTVVALLSPALAWLCVLTLLPLGLLLYYSVLSRGAWGTIAYTFTLDNYRQVLDPLFLRVLLRSLGLALLTTVITLPCGYALAYWMALRVVRYKSLCLLLVIVPFWSSDLVRIYAWITLLADHGLINNTLRAVGLLREPLPLLHTPLAVLLGLVYTYLPFMVIPLYAALERLDHSLLEAAADLGARPGRRFAKVTLPLTRGGILSGAILVFVPALGEFLIPELLGGAKVMLVGKFIALKFTGLRHWPLGAAFALVLVAIIVGVLLVYLWLGGGKEALQEQTG